MDEKDKFYRFEGGINIDADDTISSVFDVSVSYEEAIWKLKITNMVVYHSMLIQC